VGELGWLRYDDVPWYVGQHAPKAFGKRGHRKGPAIPATKKEKLARVSSLCARWLYSTN